MTSLIVFIVVGLVLYLLNRASKETAHALENGKYALRMHRLYQLVGAAGVSMSLIILSIPILAGEYTAEIFTVSGVMFLIFGGLSTYILLWYRNHRVSFDDVRIVSHNISGKEQLMNWTDVASASFKPFAGVMALSDGDGNIVKVHSHLVGFSTFIETMLVQKDRYGFKCERLPTTA